MLFLLIFIITNVTAQYDNTVQSSLAYSQLLITEPCIIQHTEHFSLKDNVVIPGKLSLQSTRLIQHIMDHFKFLLNVEEHIMWSPGRKRWFVILPLKKVFEYTPLSTDLINSMNSCHPFLLLQKNNSLICKNNAEIRYTKQECIKMIEKLMRSSTHPPVASSMTNLQDDIIYTMIEQTDGSVLFADIVSICQ